MILQALKSYYDRANLAPPGWEYKEIPFVIVLDREGNFVRLENKTSDENRRGKPILVPQSEIRSGKNAWQKTNLLWEAMSRSVLNEVGVTALGWSCYATLS